MAFDPDREIEKIEGMKEAVRAQFDRSTRNNANSPDLEQRKAAASSASAYAALVRAQAELYRVRKGGKPYSPAKL
jgi:hypothetical protein